MVLVDQSHCLRGGGFGNISAFRLSSALADPDCWHRTQIILPNYYSAVKISEFCQIVRLITLAILFGGSSAIVFAIIALLKGAPIQGVILVSLLV